MDFKETCLWMSYRYAIGRKSIAAVSHAAEIAKHLDWIPDDRWEFTAEDILREVNQSIGWTDNLTVMGLDGHRETDVFSVLFSFFVAIAFLLSAIFATSQYYISLTKSSELSATRKI